jgi:phosphocarrier protein HPr
MQESVMNKLRASVLMRHEVGLHARPSVKLTKLAKAFESRIDLGLSPDGPWVDAKSIVKVMAVKAAKGVTLYFRARGPDAAEAIDALRELVAIDFHGDDLKPAEGRSENADG